MRTSQAFVLCLTGMVLSMIGMQAFADNENKFHKEGSDVVIYEQVRGEVVTFHRGKRFIGWFIAGVIIGGIVVAANQPRHMADHYSNQMGVRLEELCKVTCAGEWSQWSACTKNCGSGGTRKRTRKHELTGRCKELSNFQCPYNTSQVEVCNEVCPHGGTPRGNICECAPGWKGDCCTSEVLCKVLARPRNGQIYINWPAKYGQYVTFTCNEGYYLVGNEVMKCVGKGEWTNGGLVPTCKQIKCKSPPVGPHLTILNPSSEGYMYGEEVIFSCNEGYVLRGHNKRMCIKHQQEKGRLTGSTPTCEAVNCGFPGFPLYGEIHGNLFSYKNRVNFTCATGYKLVGSQSMSCMANGKWLGMVPECVQIECEPPLLPKNAEAHIQKRLIYGTTVTFVCNEGYFLNGQQTLHCQADGKWNGTEPMCEAALCGDPGLPENGVKDGSRYFYPNNVTFSCFTGYKMQGRPTIHCQETGEWSSNVPSCVACPVNQYMDVFDQPGICQPCPEHTYTVTNGSRGRKQCLCGEGFQGPPGGPCTEITCDLLYAPDHGNMSACSNKVGSSCVFGCKDGFIIDRGSSQRTCQEDGNWDGTEPHCSPCPLNTYKMSEGSCMPCPVHSKTNSTGNMRKGCMCIQGYEGPPGGNCTDINECLENNGRGDCEDLCENRPGSFICGCSIPGYTLDDDKRHCRVEKECKNLTKNVIPENGGVACHHYYEQNSKFCQVRCNDGYEFPAGVNNYETCGPTTQYKWSFQIPDPTAVIPPCVPEYAPGFQTFARTHYFVRACDELSEIEKRQIYEEFKMVLDKNGVCLVRGTKGCDIKRMWIVCGNRTQVRTKRGTLETVSSVSFRFTVESHRTVDWEKDCPHICQTFKIPRGWCKRLCRPVYKNFLRVAVILAVRQLRDLYEKRKESAEFNAAGRDFEPVGDISSTPPEMKCDPGEEVGNRAWCVPCKAGTYLDAESRKCVSCPIGTFQPFTGQTMCVRCPPGSSNSVPGSRFCLICQPGKYGDQCNGTCECVHGHCDPRTGACTCESGWEGPRCDIDTPGCSGVSCVQGLACFDNEAPGTGFRCESCPQGYIGDGNACTKRI